MKNHLKYLVAMVMMMAGCNEPEIPASDDEFQQIYQQLHGKYKVTSAISDRPVDINRDGEPSTDLLKEILNLENSSVEIRIVKQGATQPGSIFLFVQYWSEQNFPSFTHPDDTSVMPDYAMQGVPRIFELNPSRDTLFIMEDEDTTVDQEKFPLPESVIAKGKEQIEVVIRKRMLTAEGWQTIKITSLYTRYTMIT